MADSEQQVYLGFKACGCCIAFMTPGVESERSERAELKRWVGRGYRIELIPKSAMYDQQNFMDCPHGNGSSVDDINALMARGRA